MSELKNKLLNGLWKIRFSDSLPEDWEEQLVRLIHSVVDEARDDFPFEFWKDDPIVVLRARGYYGVALNPYISKILYEWFKKWIGGSHSLTSKVKTNE